MDDSEPLVTTAQAETADTTKVYCKLFTTLTLFAAAVAVAISINVQHGGRMKAGFCTGGTTVGHELPYCSVLSEDECNNDSNCKYVDQGAINAVLISLATISLVILLILLRVVCTRLPPPDKAPNEDSTYNGPAALGRRKLRQLTGK